MTAVSFLLGHSTRPLFTSLLCLVLSSLLTTLASFAVYHPHRVNNMAPGKQKATRYNNRRPQNPIQANGHRLTHRPKTFYEPRSATDQSSSKTPNAQSNDSKQQKAAQADTAQRASQLTALQMIRDFTKEWNPDLYHNHQPFTKLPGDLAMCIIDYLRDPVDKISLALTTKSMWKWSQKILKLEDFDLQRVLPCRVSEKRGTIKPWPYFQSYRWRLIERLENEHWKACSGCLRLHPKTEFFPSELKEPANERYCRTPGLIQICPHLSLTYKKCDTLQKVLAKQAEENKRRYQDTDFSKYLYHECIFKAGATKLVVGTQPFVTENKQQLVFRQKYTLHVNSENLREDLESIESRSLFPNLCPHRSIITHCLDMLDEKSPWNNDMTVKDEADDKANVTCKGCGTYFSGFRRYVHSSSQKLRIDFFTSKLLGKDLGLQDCMIGHGISNELQTWIDKTQLSNIVNVTDTVHYGCKCRKKCRKLGYVPISCPSPRASLPDTTWKGEVITWPY